MSHQAVSMPSWQQCLLLNGVEVELELFNKASKYDRLRLRMLLALLARQPLTSSNIECGGGERSIALLAPLIAFATAQPVQVLIENLKSGDDIETRLRRVSTINGQAVDLESPITALSKKCSKTLRKGRRHGRHRVANEARRSSIQALPPITIDDFSDEDRPVFGAKQLVHIDQKALLDDSDGFPLTWRDRIAIGPEKLNGKLFTNEALILLFRRYFPDWQNIDQVDNDLELVLLALMVVERLAVSMEESIDAAIVPALIEGVKKLQEFSTLSGILETYSSVPEALTLSEPKLWLFVQRIFGQTISRILCVLLRFHLRKAIPTVVGGMKYFLNKAQQLTIAVTDLYKSNDSSAFLPDLDVIFKAIDSIFSLHFTIFNLLLQTLKGNQRLAGEERQTGAVLSRLIAVLKGSVESTESSHCYSSLVRDLVVLLDLFDGTSLDNGLRSPITSFGRLLNCLTVLMMGIRMLGDEKGETSNAHHLPIFGESTNGCMMEYCFSVISVAFQNTNDSEMKRQIIAAILDVTPGICCCLPRGIVISTILYDLGNNRVNWPMLVKALIFHLTPNRRENCPSCCVEVTANSTAVPAYIHAVNAELNKLSTGISEDLADIIDLILPVKSIELLAIDGLLPLLQRCCSMSTGEAGQNMVEISRILYLMAETLTSDRSIQAFIPIFLRLIEPLIDRPLTRPAVFRCTRRIFAMGKTNATYDEIDELSSFLVNRLQTVLRTGAMDVTVLVADSTQRFHDTVVALLDVTHFAIRLQSSSFMNEFHSKCAINECHQLADACIEWISTPSTRWIRVYRTTQLLMKSVTVLLAFATENVKTDLISRLERRLMDSINETSAKSSILLSCLGTALIEFSMEEELEKEKKECKACKDDFKMDLRPYEGDDEESQPDALQSSNNHLTHGLIKKDSTHRLRYPEVCVIAINYLTKSLSIAAITPTDRMEYAIASVCHHLQAVFLESKANLEIFRQKNQLITALFNLADAIIECGRSTPNLRQALALIAGLICAKPNAKHLAMVMQLNQKVGQLQLAVIEILLEILNVSPFEPAECLLFPQTLHDDLYAPRKDSNSPLQRTFSKDKTRKSTAMLQRSHSLLEWIFPASLHAAKLERESGRSTSEIRLDVAGDGTTGSNTGLNGTADSGHFTDECAAMLSLGGPVNISLNDGLSIAFWIRIDTDQPGTIGQNCHVCSIGNHRLVCTLLLSTNSESALLRITAKDFLVNEKRFHSAFPRDRWIHCVLALQAESHNGLQIQLIIDSETFDWQFGWPCEEQALQSTFKVGFGAIVTSEMNFPPPVTYELSTMFAFRGVLSRHCAVALRGLGHRCVSLASTRLNELQPALYHCLRWKLVSGDAEILEALLNDSQKHVQKLQRALLFVIRSSSAQNFGVSVLQPGVNTDSIDSQSMTCLTTLRDHPIKWRSRIVQRTIGTVDEHMETLGGMKLFMMMFALAIDQASDGPVQSNCLRLLLHAVHRSSSWHNVFGGMHGYAMLARCLTSSLAIVDVAMVQALGETAIGGLERAMEVRPLALKAKATSVIRDAKLLVSVLCKSEIWGGGDRFLLWSGLVRLLVDCCVDTKNRCHQFNRQQLTRVSFLPCILQTCLEMIQDAGDFQCSPQTNNNGKEIANCVVPLVSALLGNPETTETVTDLWHFIFLSHPAACTYINYRITGHCDWIDTESMQEERIGQVVGDSDLTHLLRNYVGGLGKDRISSILRETGCVSAVRKAYETTVSASPSDPFVGSPGTIVPIPSPSPSTVTSGSEVAEGPEIDRSLPDLLSNLQQRSEQHSDDADFSLSDNGGPQSEEEDPIVRNRQLKISDRKAEECAWVVQLRAGCLEALSVVIQNGADATVHCLLHDVISWQSIVVLLAHQSDPKIRDAVFALLENLLLRSPPAVRLSFLKLNGFSLLANQLREYPASRNIANCLFGLLCNVTIRLENGLDAEHIFKVEVDRFSCGAFIPIFAMLEQSSQETSMFWNVVSALQKIFDTNSMLMQAMMDSQLVETLVNVLRNIAMLEDCEIDISGVSSKQVLLDCWTSLVNSILYACVPYNDFNHYRQCQKLIWLLMIADWNTNGRPRELIRRQLSIVLRSWIDAMHTVFVDEGLSASAAPSMESLSHYSPSTTPSDEFYPDPSMTGISSRMASSLQGTSPMAALFSGSFANLREKIVSLGSNIQDNLKCRYRKRSRMSLAGHMELVERLQFCLTMCSNLFVNLNPTEQTSDEEEHLFDYYLYFLLNTWKKEASNKQDRLDGRRRHFAGGASSSDSTSSTIIWERLLYASRDKVRQLLAQLVAFVLFPAEKKLQRGGNLYPERQIRLELTVADWHRRRQLLVAKALANEIQYKQMLRSLLEDYQHALNLALNEILLFGTALSSDDINNLEKLLRFLKHVQIESPLCSLTPDRLNSLSTDEMLSLHSYLDQRRRFVEQLKEKADEMKTTEKKRLDLISQTAMSVTCEVVEAQNVPRKRFIQWTKMNAGEALQAEERLRKLVVELCHPAAICHDPRSWPTGWCIEPTEAPNRERKRLMACHLSLEHRFLLRDQRYKLDARNYPQPIVGLLCSQPTGASSRRKAPDEPLTGLLVDSLRIDECIRQTMLATIVRSNIECSGEILIGDRKFYFVGDSTRSAQKGIPQQGFIAISWAYSEVIEIYRRYHLLTDTSVEAFFNNGDTYLIVFETTQIRNQFYSHLLSMDLVNLVSLPDNLLQSTTQWWREGKITNFEYLMHLNKLAGRSYSDLMQYPVFPFILADYSSATLDLNKPQSYRNLARPMAVQDRRMEDHYLKNYQCLQVEARRAAPNSNAPLHFGPYHYGSHYSNSGIVVHYLVRLPPYTYTALEYQDNNFDIADRLFNSLETTWRLSSSESTTDFKELIPEFFFLPEFLINGEGLNLGVRQAGDRVNNVHLPQWCPNADPRLFILIHRQALENPLVTANLHSWIDLIFGYKQTGPAAIEALNVFHPATYHGTEYNLESRDELSKSAIKTMVRTYGQMPKQLFRTPHLPHFDARTVQSRIGTPSLLNSVLGLRWGCFVGSPEPEVGEPTIVLTNKLPTGHGPYQLAAMPESYCIAFPMKIQMLIRNRVEKRETGSRRIRETEFVMALGWQFPDAIVRVRTMYPETGPWINLMALQNSQVTASEYCTTNGRLLLGYKSGIVRIFQLDYWDTTVRKCIYLGDLYGHRNALVTMAISVEFSIIVTGCADGRVIVWDLNKMSYVRTLCDSQQPIVSIAVHSVSGDIALVFYSGYGSRLSLYTINGRLVGSIETSITITSMAMTTMPEGTGINCIAMGLQNGIIRIINMWTLTHVRDVSNDQYLEAIMSLQFTSGCKRLYASLASGRVLCWQGLQSRVPRPARLDLLDPFE